MSKPEFLEFFAGSGLVTTALKPYFKAVWANDNSEKKAAIYKANHLNSNFHFGSITDVNGKDLPNACLSWASFPCQDLSLAGLSAGINGERSGMVWEWLRVMDEMPKKPSILVAENVVGLVSSKGGTHYHALHQALTLRGYKVGAIMLDAVKWLPQSRQRVFVIAVLNSQHIPEHLLDSSPNWAHSSAVIKAAQGLENWIWWKLPEPPPRTSSLEDIVDWSAPCDPPETAARKILSISPKHKEILDQYQNTVAPGYRRTRANGPVLELRFDGIAGCLRTAEGGSSRQILVIKRSDSQLDTRLLTVREAARLMGAPESYKLPGSYNEGYTAMGDAVAVPVAAYLAKHLLKPLASISD